MDVLGSGGAGRADKVTKVNIFWRERRKGIPALSSGHVTIFFSVKTVGNPGTKRHNGRDSSIQSWQGFKGDHHKLSLATLRRVNGGFEKEAGGRGRGRRREEIQKSAKEGSDVFPVRCGS